ncbi:MAG: glycosyltransferase family 2 protein [Muribaculaceae bacterium]|nr:glycosyltransferase family 2 protein [Muribaculaceae bacterium]
MSRSNPAADTSSLTPFSDGITVIIPVFNRGGIIGDTLRSIEVQTRWPDRIIMVDNNSTDNSLEVISRWAEKWRPEGKRIDIITEKRPGAAAARKAGERLVDTRYLYFFDSDDEMHPDLIEKAMKDFESDPELKITAWSLRFKTPEGREFTRRILPDRPFENHLVQGFLSTQGYAVETQYFLEAGGWNPDLRGWDDWELGLRLLLAGGKLLISEEPRADIRMHEDSISGFTYLHSKGVWEIAIEEMERVAKKGDSPMRSYILRMLAFRRAILAAHYHHEGDKDAARSLLSTALSAPELSSFHRLIFRLAYRFTSLGLRGAGLLFPRFLVQ